jgi:signal peptidase I
VPDPGDRDIAPPDEGRPRRGFTFRSAVEWLAIVAGALVVALIVKATLLQAFYIPSESMEPTLKIGDRVLVDKVSYRFRDVHRGDIVVFERPGEEPAPEVKDLIKRVVGLPGETIEARDGHVYIDGHRLREPYLEQAVVTNDLPRQKVPLKHYWVMGDNRANSRDSRYFKAIAKSEIVGRAFIRVWPLSSLSLL